MSDMTTQELKQTNNQTLVGRRWIHFFMVLFVLVGWFVWFLVLVCSWTERERQRETERDRETGEKENTRDERDEQ